jgi:hypothetical protein
MSTSPLVAYNINDFTQLTRLGLEDRLRTLFYQLNPNWDDFSSNHPENLLLAGTALLGALIAGATDEKIRQLYWSTVTERKSIIRLAKPIDFTLTGREAASVDGYFYLPNSQNASADITIPAGTRVLSNDKIFTILTAASISTGANASGTVSAENVEEYTDTFSSDGAANIEIKLSQTNVIDGSLTVECTDGTYTNVDDDSVQYRSFLDMKPQTKGYISYVDNRGSCYIQFGNGIYGAIPPQGAIEVTYKAGGGADGSVNASAAWQVLDTISDDNGDAVSVLFTNPAASTGGDDEMSVYEARTRGPRHRRLIRACTNEDQYETVATDTSGIARSAMVTSNWDETVAEDAANLYLVAYGTAYSDSGHYPPATPTAAQIAAVQAKIAQSGANPGILDFMTTVVAATFTTINIAVRVHKSANYTGAQVKTNITSALQQLFAVADDNKEENTYIDFGYKLLDADGDPDYKLAYSLIYNAIYDSAGVREIPPGQTDLLVNGVRASYTLDPIAFPLLGTITIYDMDASGVEL